MARGKTFTSLHYDRSERRLVNRSVPQRRKAVDAYGEREARVSPTGRTSRWSARRRLRGAIRVTHPIYFETDFSLENTPTCLGHPEPTPAETPRNAAHPGSCGLRKVTPRLRA